MNESSEKPIQKIIPPAVAETSPEAPKENVEREQLRKRVVELAKEIVASNEVFPFPGIKPEDYLAMKKTDEDFPGYTTPIDEIVSRLKNEGMKIVLGEHPEDGMVYILPLQSNGIRVDSIRPKHLEINDTLKDERLLELIELDKNWRKLM